MGLFSSIFKSEYPGDEPVEASDKSVATASPPEAAKEVARVPTSEQHISLQLGDVLTRIPAHFLTTHAHDRTRPLRFKLDDLFSNIARGRATIPLSRIAEYCPDIFSAPITSAEDIDIPLPLQKVVEQIGQFPRGQDPIEPPAAGEFAAVAREKNNAPADSEATPVIEKESSHPPVSEVDLNVQRHASAPDKTEPSPPLVAEKNSSPNPPSPSPTPIPTNMIAPTQTPSSNPALSMTRLDLNHDQIVKLLSDLGGISACIISSKNRLTLTGEIPSEFDIQKFRDTVPEFLRSVENYSGQMKLGRVQNISINCEKFLVSFFSHSDVVLGVFHRDQNLLPGVREKLAAVAEETSNGHR